MGVTAAGIQTDFSEILKYGDLLRLKYYTRTLNAGSYDNDFVLAQSGANFWASGIVQPITSATGTFDNFLLEQGRILMSDKKLFIQGTILTSGIIKIGIGSPTPSREYGIINDGIFSNLINGSAVFKKIYCRALPNGSLIGE